MTEYQVTDQASEEALARDDVLEALDRFEPVDDLLERCEAISHTVANRQTPGKKVVA